MRTVKFLVGIVAMMTVSSFLLTGCAVNFFKQSPRSKEQIKELESQISDLERQRAEEQAKFEEVKRMLENKLREQIANNEVALEMTDRGLVIIVSDEILFDSGKADVKSKAFPTLDKVCDIINKNVPDKNIGVAGHTDNVPITHSNWGTNWELSTARATNVLHYMEKAGVTPSKLSATGYGEHHPIASNDTPQGRMKNRRVEIVILPQFVEKREANFSSDIK